jgi:putative hydrolase of the HAD superfamily
MKMIFFDLDGTLLDHVKAEALGIKGFYKQYETYFPLDEDEFHKEWCGIGEKHFVRYLNSELTYSQQRIERIKEIFALVGQYLSDDEAEKRFLTYLRIYENSWEAFDDVIPCLKGLKSYRLGIISNGDEQHQIMKLKHMGINDYFECIVTAGGTGYAKPDLKIFEIACDSMKLSPNDCCYVGDDIKNDILPCKQIGMKGIWLNRRNENCDTVNINMIKNLDELKQQLMR